MRTRRRGDIANACTLRAIRMLIHDPQWAPASVVDLIERHHGFPLSHLDILPLYAPLVIWRPSDLATLDCWQTFVRIVDASGRFQLLIQGDLLVPCFLNANGRGHMEAVKISEIVDYFQCSLVAFLTYNKEEAGQWRSCRSCEMLMPPAHSCFVAERGYTYAENVQ